MLRSYRPLAKSFRPRAQCDGAEIRATSAVHRHLCDRSALEDLNSGPQVRGALIALPRFALFALAAKANFYNRLSAGSTAQPQP
jgi:hypothetical protein